MADNIETLSIMVKVFNGEAKRSFAEMLEAAKTMGAGTEAAVRRFGDSIDLFDSKLGRAFQALSRGNLSDRAKSEVDKIAAYFSDLPKRIGSSISESEMKKIADRLNLAKSITSLASTRSLPQQGLSERKDSEFKKWYDAEIAFEKAYNDELKIEHQKTIEVERWYNKELEIENQRREAEHKRRIREQDQIIAQAQKITDRQQTSEQRAAEATRQQVAKTKQLYDIGLLNLREYIAEKNRLEHAMYQKFTPHKTDIVTAYNDPAAYSRNHDPLKEAANQRAYEIMQRASGASPSDMAMRMGQNLRDQELQAQRQRDEVDNARRQAEARARAALSGMSGASPIDMTGAMSRGQAEQEQEARNNAAMVRLREIRRAELLAVARREQQDEQARLAQISANNQAAIRLQEIRTAELLAARRREQRELAEINARNLMSGMSGPSPVDVTGRMGATNNARLAEERDRANRQRDYARDLAARTEANEAAQAQESRNTDAMLRFRRIRQAELLAAVTRETNERRTQQQNATLQNAGLLNNELYVYRRHLRELRNLYQLGTITEQQYLEGRRNLRNDYAGATGGMNQGRMRFISQNLAYGADDFMQVYGMSGMRGGMRAISNNLSAVAGTMITNPLAAGAAIVGTSALTAGLGSYFGQQEDAEKKAVERKNEALERTKTLIREISDEVRRSASVASVVSTGDIKGMRSQAIKLEDSSKENKDEQGKLYFELERERKSSQAISDRATAKRVEIQDSERKMGNAALAQGELSNLNRLQQELVEIEESAKQQAEKELEISKKIAELKAEEMKLRGEINNTIQKGMGQARDSEKLETRVTDIQKDAVKTIDRENRTREVDAKDPLSSNEVNQYLRQVYGSIRQDYIAKIDSWAKRNNVNRFEAERRVSEFDDNWNSLIKNETEKASDREFDLSIQRQKQSKKDQGLDVKRTAKEIEEAARERDEYSRMRISALQQTDKPQAIREELEQKRKTIADMKNTSDYDKAKLGDLATQAAMSELQGLIKVSMKPSLRASEIGSQEDASYRNSFNQVISAEKRAAQQRDKMLKELSGINKNTKVRPGVTKIGSR